MRVIAKLSDRVLARMHERLNSLSDCCKQPANLSERKSEDERLTLWKCSACQRRHYKPKDGAWPQNS